MAATNRKPVAVWWVREFLGPNYFVFARSARGALSLIASNHFGLKWHAYKADYDATAELVPARQKIVVNDEDTGKTEAKTARAWAKGQKPGLFCSDEYY